MRYHYSSYDEGVFDEYLFEKNLQGDVVAVYDINGMKLVSYTYDAWGNFETTYHNGGASTTATNNPFRYRGYYYDSDLGWYYLNTRYYSPELGRFISADAADVITLTPYALTDKNLYAYCDNNPIMRKDDGGEFWGAITGAIVGAVFGGIKALSEENDFWAGVGIGALAGAVSGLAVDLAVATGGAAGVVIAMAGGFVSSFGEDLANNAVNNKKNNLEEMFSNATFSAATNFLSFGMGLEDGIKTGAKTLKQVFQYSGENFVKGSIASSVGRVPKSLGSKISNFAKNAVSELTGSFIFDSTMDWVSKILSRCFGGT